MCFAIPAPAESKEEEDNQTNPPSTPDAVSKTLDRFFDSEEWESAFDDAPTPISVVPPSGDVVYLSDVIYNKEAHKPFGLSYNDLKSPFPSSSKVKYSSWYSLADSNENPQAWDPEPNHSDDARRHFSKNEDLPSAVVPSGVGAGLSNLGNTCFMNAILQCFTHTVPLVEGLRSSGHSFPCDCYNNEFCVICALRAQIECSLAASGGMVSPLKLVKNLNYFSSSFRRYQQEDAHEFMQCALDKLDLCFLDLKENNLVEKIFGGRLISKLRCSSCGHSSNTYEPLIDLSLEIENVDNLPSALESFTKLEHIDANFKCDGCKEEVSLEKQLLLDQTPSVAAFHLKRFKTDGTFVEKLDKHVNFPLELDLQPYSISDQNSNEPMKYDLYAVVVHIGLSATSGHYFCYVRSAPNVWHKLDDSQVTMVSAESVLCQEAYILFYAQHGTPWFSTIMESPMPCLDPSIWNTSPKSVLDKDDSSDKPNPIITENVVRDEANESKEFSEKQVDYSCKKRIELHKQFPSKPNQESVGLNTYTIQAKVPLGKSAILNVSALVDGKSHVQSGVPDKNNHGQEVVDFGSINDDFNHLTPPSSPSLDSPDRSYHIPRDHLKKENSGSCKKSKNKYKVDAGDSERKAAARYLSKMQGGSKKDALMELVGCSKEVSLNKKRKEFDSSLCKEGSHHSVPKKANHSSVMCPVAAGSSQ